jgi:hypothetical protein
MQKHTQGYGGSKDGIPQAPADCRNHIIHLGAPYFGSDEQFMALDQTGFKRFG